MKNKVWFLLILYILFLTACTEESYILCPDNVTNVIDIEDCPKEKPKCPECDDNNSCTLDKCSELTDYKCVNEEIKPCDGNNICEEGEFPWSDDCPKSCDDNDECTEDTYNYELERCIYAQVIPCCGNKECDKGETYVNCPLDCEQELEIYVTRYEKRVRVEGAYADLRGTDHIYLLVRFKINNLAIDKLETLNYRKERGFYYDPFKMRLEDDTGRIYKPEYDSDLIKGWLDYDIIPKGHLKGAALLFIVPMYAENVRLIAYDKYGSRLDISEVY